MAAAAGLHCVTELTCAAGLMPTCTREHKTKLDQASGEGEEEKDMKQLTRKVKKREKTRKKRRQTGTMTRREPSHCSLAAVVVG